MTVLHLPTFLIGPSQGARSSTILERSGDGEAISDAERRLLNDLPLAIAGWMRRRQEDEIWGCLPLTRGFLGGRVLFRAAYHRDLGGEPTGLASAVYLGREVLQALDGHAERLISFLQPPERGSSFTAGPLTLSLAEVPPPHARPLAIGLEWEDRAVQVLDTSEAVEVAARLLAGIGQSAPARRVLGWITTAHFPRLGGIDPRASFQLVVHRGDPPEDPYRTTQWLNGQINGAAVAPPPAWPAWQALHARLADDPELAEACDWAGILASVAAADVPEALLQRLLAWPDTGPRLYLALLMRLAGQGDITNPAAQLHSDATGLDPAPLAALMSALLVQPPRALDQLGAERLLRQRPWLLGQIDPPALDAALKTLHALDWDELDQDLLTRLPPHFRFAALDAGLDRIEADPQAARLIVPAVRVLVGALLTERDSTVQADPRTSAALKRIEQVQNQGKAELVAQQHWGTFAYLAKRLPDESGASIRQSVMNVDRDLPRSLNGLGRLAWLIGEVVSAGEGSGKRILR